MPVRVLSTLCVLVGLSLSLGACASDGRELAEPRDWQTTTTRPPPPTSAPPQQISESGLTLTSPDFEPGGEVPAVARCDGENKFPGLRWTDVSADAVELAVVLADQTDPEEPLLVWLMAGIDPGVGGLESGRFPNDGAFETLNDYGQPGYGSPCLETIADGRRDLQFQLYVLTSASGLETGAPGNTSWDTVAALASDTATLLMRIDAAI